MTTLYLKRRVYARYYDVIEVSLSPIVLSNYESCDDYKVETIKLDNKYATQDLINLINTKILS